MKRLILAAMLTTGALALAHDPYKYDSNKSASTAGKDADLFTASKNYDVDGTLAKVQFGKITISRPGLPDAVLNLKDQTTVMLDGSNSDAKSLPEGASIRAKFQLDGANGVALKVEAKSPSPGRSTDVR